MASARYIKRGQNLLCCQLCNTNVKLEYKCIYCKLLLCKQCEKSHRETTGHLVMCIEDIGTHEGKIDFSDLKCDAHSSLVRYFCTTCDKLVCSTCVKNNRDNHTLIEIGEGFDLLKRVFKIYLEKFEDHLSNLSSLIHNLTQFKKVQKKKVSNEKLIIKRHADELKRAIDVFVDEMTTEIKKEGRTVIRAIEGDLDELLDMKRNAEENVTKVQEQIQNCNAVTFFKFGCEFPIPKTSLPTLPSLYLTVPKFIPGNIDRSIVGELKINEISTESKEMFFEQVEHYMTELGFINAVCSCLDKTVLLMDPKEEILQLVKPVGKELNVLTKYHKNVFDIKLYSPTQVLLSLEGETVLKLMNIASGQMEDSVYDVTPLFPRAFDMTYSNEIIVRANNFTRDKVSIILLDSHGQRKNVYTGDMGYAFPLLSPLSVAMTSNRLIHVGDCKIGCRIGKVTVINEEGKLQNVYCGHPQVNRDVMFLPQHLTLTPADNVLVADQNSCFLHVLNNCGYLLSFIKVNDIGSCLPIIVSFSSDGTLYIACNSNNADEKPQICVVKKSPI